MTGEVVEREGRAAQREWTPRKGRKGSKGSGLRGLSWEEKDDDDEEQISGVDSELQAVLKARRRSLVIASASAEGGALPLEPAIARLNLDKTPSPLRLATPSNPQSASPIATSSPPPFMLSPITAGGPAQVLRVVFMDGRVISTQASYSDHLRKIVAACEISQSRDSRSAETLWPFFHTRVTAVWLLFSTCDTMHSPPLPLCAPLLLNKLISNPSCACFAVQFLMRESWLVDVSLT